MLLGSDSILNIGINIYGKDNFTGAAATASRSMKQLESDFRQTMMMNLRAAKDFYGGMAAMGAAAIGAMAGAVVKGADLNLMLTDTRIAADASTESMKKLREQVMSLGDESLLLPTQVASAQRMIARAGFSNVDDIKNVTRAAAMLSGATGERLEGTGGSGEVLTNILFGYKIQAADAARVTDQVTYAMNKSFLSMENVSESFKYGGAAARMFGGDLQSALSTYMVLANVGIKGSISGTTTENIYRYLGKAAGGNATGVQKRGMAALGLSPQDLKDAHGNLLPLIDLLGLLGERSKGLTTISSSNALYDLIGVRATKGGAALGAELGKLKEYQATLNSTGIKGKAEEYAKERANTVSGAINRIASAFQKLAASLAMAVAPFMPIIEILAKVLGAVGKVLESPLGKPIMMLIGGMLLLKTATFAYRAVVAGLKLVFVDARVNFVNMQTAMEIGWQRLQNSALRYGQAARAATYNGTTGMGPGGAAGGLNGINPIGNNIQQVTLANGRTAYRNMATGRFASQAAYNASLQGQQAGFMGGMLANGMKTMGIVGGGLGMLSYGMDYAKTGNMGSLAGGLTSAAATGLAFIPGWGPVASMALTMGSGLIASLFDNTDAMKKATKETQENTHQMSRSNMNMMMNVLDRMPKDVVRRFRYQGETNNDDFNTDKSLNDYKRRVENGGDSKPFYSFADKGKVSVYLNGKIIDTKDIEKTVDKQLYSAFKF